MNVPVGLLDRFYDGINVQGTDGAQVDDFSFDALLRKLSCGLQTVGDHLAVRHKCKVGALELDLALANRDQEVVGHGLR